MAEDTTTPPETAPPAPGFTQADVDRIVGERLARERERFADYDELKAKAGKLDEAAAELETVRTQVAALEPKVTRLTVALDKGLPADLADRLRGDTEDELKADADKLLALVVKDDTPRPPAPDPRQGGNGGGPLSTAQQFAGAIEGAFTT